MKLIKFKEQNATIAEHQPEYLPMPAFINTKEGYVICCWKLSLLERIKLFFIGKVWHRMLTFNQPLQPQLLTIDNPFRK